MSNEFRTIKIWFKTYKIAKTLAIQADKSLVQFLHDLVTREENRENDK
jgi:hypothetical protein